MNRIALLLIGLALASSALAQKTSLVGGTVINPADGKTIENAVVVVNGDKIESVASRKESGVPVGSKWVEIEKGYFADLVILKSNPAEDIAHASDIDSVIKNGVLYPAAELLPK
jgi:imidazolonepropionase-like amidohydrolase